MKKCEYCGKEISYHEQYCSEDCHLNANRFYERSEKLARPFYFLSTVCVIGIPIGLFLFSFMRLPGAVIAAVCCEILGIMILLAPMPTEGMIKKNKIKKAMAKTRIFGLCMLALGFLIVGLLLFFGI